MNSRSRRRIHTAIEENIPAAVQKAVDGLPEDSENGHKVRRIYHSESFSFTDLRSGESNYIRTGDRARRTLDIILKNCPVNLDESPG